MINKRTLIIPAAGESSRFPGIRPKYLLTMRDGRLMLEHAMSCILQTNQFDRIIIACKEEHLNQFTSTKTLKNILNAATGQSVELFQLKHPTSSQSETIAITLKEMGVVGAFLIKDCDNAFEFNWSGGNEVAVLDISTEGVRDISGKSYVRTDPLGSIQNIVEKHIISNTFCCGAYGFSSAQDFLHVYDGLVSDSEVYVSHVVFQMLLEGFVFNSACASKYSDWGTIEAYRQYMSSGLTIFCDIDGVILQNGSKFGINGWRTPPIEANLHALKSLTEALDIYLVITSSRPDSERKAIEEILSSYGLIAKAYLLGLPHTKRVLINDYSATNPFPTAIALNIERDSRSLDALLGSLKINN